MAATAIHFGTSGWRGIIAEDFTFPNVRLCLGAIAEHVLANRQGAGGKPAVLVGHDRRFFSEDFAQTAAIVLTEYGITPLVAVAAAPTPAIAYEVRRQKLDGAINFTASHNPAEYHGLKFSGPDGGPALPEVTRDIEARAAKLAGSAKAAGGYPTSEEMVSGEKVDFSAAYLARMAELVRFDAMRGANIVYDALHGCGAGYLDRALADHGAKAHTIRAQRDVLFDGTGPDVSEENLQPLSAAVRERKAEVGLATDGDADRFGIVDADGTWISPNYILALVYDYLVESRGWKMDAARSVATSHLMDAVATHHGRKTHQTPVGFKYIGQLILKDEIALGGEESAGLTIRGHVPEKDGILAGLLVAEMIGACRASIAEQLKALFRKVGREYWPVRANLHLPEDVKANTVARLKNDYTKFLGRSVASADRTDGLKMVFDDGNWILLRLSGTEPLLRIYTEAHTRQEADRLVEQARDWVFGATGAAA